MARAHRAVKRAVDKGELQPPYSFSCVDCGNDAEVYDHRDYLKPLDVHPVCRGCNVRRGSAINP
jgi:predicted nucleic acid-binding Zn ribbon protein